MKANMPEINPFHDNYLLYVTDEGDQMLVLLDGPQSRWTDVDTYVEEIGEEGHVSHTRLDYKDWLSSVDLDLEAGWWLKDSNVDVPEGVY